MSKIDDLADFPAGTRVTCKAKGTASSSLINEGVFSSSEVASLIGATDPDLDNNRDAVTLHARIFHDSFDATEE